MRMRGMADAFVQQQEDPQTSQLSFEERFALLVDRQWNWRQNRALERRLKEARLQGNACVEDIDFRAARGLDKPLVRSRIQDSDWVRRHQHIFLIGPTGIGKTYLARAFGQKACRDGLTAYFVCAPRYRCTVRTIPRADRAYLTPGERDSETSGIRHRHGGYGAPYRTDPRSRAPGSKRRSREGGHPDGQRPMWTIYSIARPSGQSIPGLVGSRVRFHLTRSR